ncbi:MAG: LytR/AlgR family response regulator transcription factor [Flavobacteriales bacterium]
MIRILIIEDEISAVENLIHKLNKTSHPIRIEKIIDTVSEAVDYINTQPEIDLAFVDIHLADGNSFEIFDQCKVNMPVIFTTAFDQYAIKAFKVNSVDYLLKPLDDDELNRAILKFTKFHEHNNIENIKQVLKHLNKKEYKSTYLIRKGDKLVALPVSKIAYFFIDSNIVYAYTFEKEKMMVDKKLDEITAELNPNTFFRANRQVIIHRLAFSDLEYYFNGKMILNLNPKGLSQIIISKAKVPLLKDWIKR